MLFSARLFTSIIVASLGFEVSAAVVTAEHRPPVALLSGAPINRYPGSDQNALSQSFTVGVGGELHSVSYLLRRPSSAVVWIDFFLHRAENNVPVGAPITGGSYYVGPVGSGFKSGTTLFSGNPIHVTAGEEYALVFSDPTSDGSAIAELGVSALETNTYDFGALYREDSSGVFVDQGLTNQDAWFAVFVTPDRPTLSIETVAPGQVRLSWGPDYPGAVLQETDTLLPLAWTNAPSGATNPVTLPASGNGKLYRVLTP